MLRTINCDLYQVYLLHKINTSNLDQLKQTDDFQKKINR